MDNFHCFVRSLKSDHGKKFTENNNTNNNKRYVIDGIPYYRSGFVKP